MRLLELRDVIDTLLETEPWSFTGEDFLRTLVMVRLPERELVAPFPDGLNLPSPFILVDHVAHVPETIATGFDTLRDLEGAILCASGYTNNFTTHSFAFIEGKPHSFNIVYRNETGAEVVFSKADQIAKNDFSRAYADLRLEWL